MNCHITWRSSWAILASLSLTLTALVSAPVQAKPVRNPTTYSGRAFAAYVNTAVTGPIYLSDTGSLPAAGGSASNSLLSTRGTAPIDSVLLADVLVASTSGASGAANSSASLANVVVFPGTPNELRVSFLRAQSQATCSGVSGSSELAEVTFGGQSITVSGAENQTITLPGNLATLVINEQKKSGSGNYRQIDVNAIHLTVPGVGEVILSGVHSDINCAVTAPGPCHDFMTGGGFVYVGDDKGTFGFNVGYKANSTVPDVHLTYIDHTTQMKVKATGATVYTVTGPTSRHIEGTAEIDGVPGTFVLDIADNGEPGRGTDVFRLTLSNGYTAGGTLAAGNIQLHAPCQKTRTKGRR